MFLLGCPIGEAVRRKQNVGDKANPWDRENKGGAGRRGWILQTRKARQRSLGFFCGEAQQGSGLMEAVLWKSPQIALDKPHCTVEPAGNWEPRLVRSE